MTNAWLAHADRLREAFTDQEGDVTFQMVLRALGRHARSPVWNVADIGGGHGRLALELAARGHTVTVLDPDPHMLQSASDRLAGESDGVRGRVTLIQGEGEDAAALLGRDRFDVVCCHSVVMYVPDPGRILGPAVSLARPGTGVVSVLANNPEAVAMRCGLQQRWADVVEAIATHRDPRTLPTYPHTRGDLVTALEEAGAMLDSWYGVGVFTDHHEGTIYAEDPDDVFAAEWAAGACDPYRQVARCVHLVATRA